MTIRDFTNQDRHDFLDMCREFYSGDAVDHPVDPSHFDRTFDQIIGKNPFLRGLILEEGGICAGYAQLSFTWSNEAGGDVVWIEELYIKPEFRGTGLGTQLIDLVKREYPSARRFRLEVSEENTGAMRLYKRLDFEPLPYLQMIIDK